MMSEMPVKAVARIVGEHDTSLYLRRFHVVKLLNEAVEKVQRTEQKERPELKRSRWLWLWNPDRVYLDEVGRCDIYVGLFGRDYGSEDAEGVSPTEREFDRATELEKHRLIFVKGANRSQAAATRRWTRSSHGHRPAWCEGGSRHRRSWWPDSTRRSCGTSNQGSCCVSRRSTPHPASGPRSTIWTSRTCTALFASRAGRDGTEVAKPIPSYQVYKGTVFGLVDQAPATQKTTRITDPATRITDPATQIPTQTTTQTTTQKTTQELKAAGAIRRVGSGQSGPLGGAEVT